MARKHYAVTRVNGRRDTVQYCGMGSTGANRAAELMVPGMVSGSGETEQEAIDNARSAAIATKQRFEKTTGREYVPMALEVG